MRAGSYVTALAVAALAALAFTNPASADVVNGTFIDSSGNASLAGWQWSNAVSAYSESGYPNPGMINAGNTDMAVFGAFNGYQGMLSQSLITTIGQSYVLFFQYGAGDSGTETQSLHVQAGDLDELVNSAGPGSTDYNTIFSDYTFRFTATDVSTLLTFTDVTANDGPNDNWVDGMLQNVAVSVPEPATYTVLGLGILSLCAVRRRQA